MLGVSGFLVAAPALAQTRLGLKGGLNVSSFYGDAIGEAESVQGHLIGAFANFGLSGPLSAQVEGYYATRGAIGHDIHADRLGDVTDWRWHYNYLDFASLLKLRVSPGASAPSVSVFAGPIVAFAVGATATGTRSKIDFPPYEGAFAYALPLDDNTHGSDFGGTAGVDLTFDLGPTRLVVDARYTKMMTELTRQSSSGSCPTTTSSFRASTRPSRSKSVWSSLRGNGAAVAPGHRVVTYPQLYRPGPHLIRN